jgi:hypothetical protein
MRGVDATPTASIPLAGGHLLTAIATSIVGILREHYGRGPMKAKTVDGRVRDRIGRAACACGGSVHHHLAEVVGRWAGGAHDTG